MNKDMDIHSTLITWVIPVYNGGRYIEQTIRSILNQPCKDLTVIVIDDGSVDSTAVIVKSINDDRVQYVYKENGGVSSARNRGIEHTKSRYIAFLDADDVLCRGIYDEELHNLLQSFRYDILRFAYFAADQNLKKGNRINVGQSGEICVEEMKRNIFSGAYIFSTDLFAKKPILRYPEGIKYREDIPVVFLTACRAEKIVNIDRELLLYRNNVSSVTHNFNSSDFPILDAVSAWHWCKNHCTRESDRNECDARMFSDIVAYIQYSCMQGTPVEEIQRKLDNPMVKETVQNYEALWNSRKMIWEEFMDHPNEYWKKMRRKGYFVNAARRVVNSPVIRRLWQKLKYKTNIRLFV